ncbi:MAG TPA: DUF1501 domain-containing protein [Deltaproteobacteria bacterium]|nr:DUF1501 domain-containing protein [Deltaproteobacteria bacterium]
MSTFAERKVRRDITRRAFLGGAAGLMASSGLWYPKKAFAAGAERKFLFCFAGGGWNTSTILDPHFDTDGVDMDLDTVLGQRGGVTFTNGPDRLEVDTFFRKWAGYSAIINGIDAHSVGHDSGTQFMMTGTSASSYADWPTTLASNTTIEYPLPHVVFSGPSFAGTSGAAVVRAGGGTLLSLLDGSINGMSDAPTPELRPPADDMIDKFVYNRVADFASQQRGLGRERADGMLANIERAMELEGREFEAGLDDLGNNLLDNMLKASEMFRLGLSRCAMVSIPGGYDSHGDNSVQAPAQVAFYAALDELFEHLSTTPGHTTKWLIDEVVVVALSEFGRTPKLNGAQGTDHWPYNSMFVAGAGVSGNQTLGKTDGGLIAEPIDLGTGQPLSAAGGGVMLGCEHVGLALLKIGGLDPSRFLPGVDVLDGLVR